MNDVAARLTTLSQSVEWPDEVDVARAVMAAVAAPGPERALRRGWVPAGRLQPAFVAVLVVLSLAATVLVASPRTRRAVASWLGLPGVEVRVGDDGITPEATSQLDLGVPVAAAVASRELRFEIAQLDLDGGVVFLDGRLAHTVYPPQDGLPATPAGAGALLTQFRSDGGEDPLFTKEILEPTGGVTSTHVGDSFALWVEGPEHVLMPNADGVPVPEAARLSANALLWTSQGRTYRLEVAVPMTAAVRLAQRLR